MGSVPEGRAITLPLSPKINSSTLDFGSKIGVISAGIAYMYAKEALGNSADYLKLGMVYPLPEKLIRDFAAKVDKVYVVEELDPFIEEHCKAIGVDVIGKDAFN